MSLKYQFPDYAELSKATPISIQDTQALLRPDEALLLILDLQAAGEVQETAFAWIVTKEAAEWVRLPIGTHGLARTVAALRCGLDPQQWSDDGGTLCKALLKLDAASRNFLPFDLNVAFELYQKLIGPFEAKIKGKHILLVPSGALTGLPASSSSLKSPLTAFPPSSRTPEKPHGLEPVNRSPCCPPPPHLSRSVSSPKPASRPNRTLASATRCSMDQTPLLARAPSSRVRRRAAPKRRFSALQILLLGARSCRRREAA